MTASVIPTYYYLPLTYWYCFSRWRDFVFCSAIQKFPWPTTMHWCNFLRPPLPSSLLQGICSKSWCMRSCWNWNVTWNHVAQLWLILAKSPHVGTLITHLWPYFLQHLENYLKEREPDLWRSPSIQEPVQFTNTNKATLVLPKENSGYRIVPDVNILEVCIYTACTVNGACFVWSSRPL